MSLQTRKIPSKTSFVLHKYRQACKLFSQRCHSLLAPAQPASSLGALVELEQVRQQLFGLKHRFHAQHAELVQAQSDNELLKQQLRLCLQEHAELQPPTQCRLF